MHITLLPQHRAGELVLEKSSGDRLLINGEEFNFNPLPDGGTIPAGQVPCELVVGEIHRIDGEVHLSVILPVGANPVGAMRFEQTVVVHDDGPIGLPAEPAPDLHQHFEEPADVEP